MISPYVRRLRLAQELKRLREAAGLHHQGLAAKIGADRSKISRLENGRIAPDINDVMKIMEALGVDGDQWTTILKVAQDAATKGWWDSGSKAMGERQTLYADLEAGAAGIREWHPGLIPGLLQIPAYTRSRLTEPWITTFSEAAMEGVVQGRAGRQRMLRSPGGPSYEVVIDEAGIRRLSAPPSVMREQLLHLADFCAHAERITVRVLLLEAVVAGYKTLPAPLSLYTYPDPLDPVIAALEAVTTDVILTSPDEVARYVRRYDALAQAALSPEDSAEFITKAARALPDHE